MSKQIEWSPRATKEYLSLLEYLLDEWGEKTVRKFSNRIETILKDISEQPKMYPASAKRKNIRRCVVTKQTSLYYRVERDKIELVTLFDSRQNLSKRNL